MAYVIAERFESDWAVRLARDERVLACSFVVGPACETRSPVAWRPPSAPAAHMPSHPSPTSRSA